MIRGFKRSRIASAAVMICSVAVAVAAWFWDKDYPFFIPLIASILMIGVGYFSSRVLGNVLASMENTRYLGYLHMELDPDKFLNVYRDVPGQMKPGSSDAAICRSYLADGYAASGDHGKAIQILSEDPPVDNLPVQGLYASNRAACYLHMGRLGEADGELKNLERIIDACRLNRAELARNLETSLKIYRQYQSCLAGAAVDVPYLEDMFQKAQYHIRRLEIAKILAQYFLREGDPAAAEKHLSYLRENGGMTFYKRWADKY